MGCVPSIIHFRNQSARGSSHDWRVLKYSDVSQRDTISQVSGWHPNHMLHMLQCLSTSLNNPKLSLLGKYWDSALIYFNMVSKYISITDSLRRQWHTCRPYWIAAVCVLLPLNRGQSDSEPQSGATILTWVAPLPNLGPQFWAYGTGICVLPSAKSGLSCDRVHLAFMFFCAWC